MRIKLVALTFVVIFENVTHAYRKFKCVHLKPTGRMSQGVIVGVVNKI